MTLRLTIGVDPGTSGAVALLADGVLLDAIDMPTMPRRSGGERVDAGKLATVIRGWRAMHNGSHASSVVEQAASRPGQGVASTFRFGEAYGAACGVLGALGISIVHAQPQTWKRAMGLQGTDKGAARTLAIETWPLLADLFRRKKDHGRADAALIALWGWQTGRHAEAG